MRTGNPQDRSRHERRVECSREAATIGDECLASLTRLDQIGRRDTEPVADLRARRHRDEPLINENS